VKSLHFEGFSSLAYFLVFILLMLFLVFAGNPLVVVQSGFVGVKRTLGKIDPVPLREELHLRIPLLQTVYLILEDVLIRDIRLPESVVKAIEEKRKAYEEAQRMQFLLEKEKLEAERKKVEAQGIAEANRIIAGSLTREYLMWKFIENIQEYARSQNNTIILLPYDTRMTPIINIPQGGQR